jgi:cysteine desulfuration protein SufE
MSQVWLVGEQTSDAPPKLKFRGDSDAHIVKGLVAVLMALYSERSPREILDTDINDAFEKLGLEGHITMNRRNGFYSMVEKIREMAAARA